MARSVKPVHADDVAETVGQKIEFARREKRLSQVGLGSLLAKELHVPSVSQGTISSMENDRQPVTREYLDAMAKVLEKPVRFFLDTDVPEDHEKSRRRHGARTTEGAMLAENLRRWTRAVGLPDDFPSLSDLADEELDPNSKLYWGYDQEEALNKILDGSQRPLAAVLVEPGQGATTLSRYVFNRCLASAVQGKLMPVRLELVEFHDPNARKLEAAITSKLHSALREGLELRWERVLGDKYLDVLRKNGLMQRGNGTSEGSGTSDLGMLLKVLHGQLGIEVSVQLDLSSRKAYEDPDTHINQVERVMNQFRAIRLKYRLTSEWVHELFFLSPTVFEQRHLWMDNRDYAHSVIPFPWYRPAEVFAILERHSIARTPRQSPSAPGAEAFAMIERHSIASREESLTWRLSSVMDPNLLERFVSQRRPLKEAVAHLRSNLRSNLRSWDNASFRMEENHA